MGQHKLQGAGALARQRVHDSRQSATRAMQSEQRSITQILGRRTRSTRGQTTESWRTKKHTASRIRDLPGHYPARMEYDQRKERQRKAGR